MDAKLIALFTQVLDPELWLPPKAEVRELREWVDRCEHLKTMLVQEENRVQTQRNEEIRRPSNLDLYFVKLLLNKIYVV